MAVYFKKLGGELTGTWTCRAQTRDYGARAGSVDTWFTAPDGAVYRSKVAAARGAGLNPAVRKARKPAEGSGGGPSRTGDVKASRKSSAGNCFTSWVPRGGSQRDLLRLLAATATNGKTVDLSVPELAELLMSMPGASDIDDCYEGLLFYKDDAEEPTRQGGPSSGKDNKEKQETTKLPEDAEIHANNLVEEVKRIEFSNGKTSEQNMNNAVFDNEGSSQCKEDPIPSHVPVEVPGNAELSRKDNSQDNCVSKMHELKKKGKNDSKLNPAQKIKDDEKNSVDLYDSVDEVHCENRSTNSSATDFHRQDVRSLKSSPFQLNTAALSHESGMEEEECCLEALEKFECRAPKGLTPWSTEIEVIRKCLVRVPLRIGRHAEDDPEPLSPESRSEVYTSALLEMSKEQNVEDCTDEDNPEKIESCFDHVRKLPSNVPENLEHSLFVFGEDNDSNYDDCSHVIKPAPWSRRQLMFDEINNDPDTERLHPIALFWIRYEELMEERESRDAARRSAIIAARREERKAKLAELKEANGEDAGHNRDTISTKLFKDMKIEEVEKMIMERLSSYFSGLGGNVPKGWQVKASIGENSVGENHVDVQYSDPEGQTYKSIVKAAENFGLDTSIVTLRSISIASILGLTPESGDDLPEKKTDENSRKGQVPNSLPVKNAALSSSPKKQKSRAKKEKDGSTVTVSNGAQASAKAKAGSKKVAQVRGKSKEEKSQKSKSTGNNNKKEKSKDKVKVAKERGKKSASGNKKLASTKEKGSASQKSRETQKKSTKGTKEKVKTKGAGRSKVNGKQAIQSATKQKVIQKRRNTRTSKVKSPEKSKAETPAKIGKKRGRKPASQKLAAGNIAVKRVKKPKNNDTVSPTPTNPYNIRTRRTPKRKLYEDEVWENVKTVKPRKILKKAPPKPLPELSSPKRLTARQKAREERLRREADEKLARKLALEEDIEDSEATQDLQIDINAGEVVSKPKICLNVAVKSPKYVNRKLEEADAEVSSGNNSDCLGGSLPSSSVLNKDPNPLDTTHIGVDLIGSKEICASVPRNMPNSDQRENCCTKAADCCEALIVQSDMATRRNVKALSNEADLGKGSEEDLDSVLHTNHGVTQYEEKINRLHGQKIQGSALSRDLVEKNENVNWIEEYGRPSGAQNGLSDSLLFSNTLAKLECEGFSQLKSGCDNDVLRLRGGTVEASSRANYDVVKRRNRRKPLYLQDSFVEDRREEKKSSSKSEVNALRKSKRIQNTGNFE